MGREEVPQTAHQLQEEAVVVFLQEADAERELCAMGAVVGVALELQEADEINLVEERELCAMGAVVGAALELQEADEINLVESQINLSPVHSHRARDKSNSP